MPRKPAQPKAPAHSLDFSAPVDAVRNDPQNEDE